MSFLLARVEFPRALACPLRKYENAVVIHVYSAAQLYACQLVTFARRVWFSKDPNSSPSVLHELSIYDQVKLLKTILHYIYHRVTRMWLSCTKQSTRHCYEA
ncbi:Hypothetical_protein [Hexamita inflata]|uniref:Hypothetical_protein n=1 Tax=Hexamita inflata TaxID=28002 RepID=A0AA86QF70_9EUKA|nr:Hypothetical protein HINF_LOCUS38365 [Hexamita inflata]